MKRKNTARAECIYSIISAARVNLISLSLSLSRSARFVFTLSRPVKITSKTAPGIVYALARIYTFIHSRRVVPVLSLSSRNFLGLSLGLVN